MKSKQVIIIRKDLNMRKGKMVAQGAHASMKVILDRMFVSRLTYRDKVDRILEITPSKDAAIKDWLDGIFTKVCVSVDSEAELLSVYQSAKDAGLWCSLIKDAGLTEFDGVPTYTACAIGPCWDHEVDSITGHLKLL
jgi:PTH2 family peptidyl-tRNA hydrolase